MFVKPRKRYLSVITALTILLFIYTMSVGHDSDPKKKLNQNLPDTEQVRTITRVKKRLRDNYQEENIKLEKESLVVNDQGQPVTDLTKVVVTEKKYLPGTDRSKIIRTKNLTYLDNNKHYTSLQSSFNCSKNLITLLVLIKSQAKSIARRKLVRATWGRYGDIKTTNHFRRFFIIGSVINKELQAFVSKEEEVYGDIIRGDFADTFYNLSEKAEVGFEWSYKHCSFKYLLEADDDVFINIPLILQKISYQVFPKINVYLGNVKLNDTVVRDGTGIYAKYSVGFEEYAGSTYQPYCSGGAYILSSDVVGKLLPYIKQHPFSIDDVYVGMLIYNAGVKPTRYEGFNLQDDDGKAECKYQSNLIALHPAKKHSCMMKLFCGMLDDMSSSLLIQRNYFSDFSFSKCTN